MSAQFDFTTLFANVGVVGVSNCRCAHTSAGWCACPYTNLQHFGTARSLYRQAGWWEPGIWQACNIEQDVTTGKLCREAVLAVRQEAGLLGGPFAGLVGCTCVPHSAFDLERLRCLLIAIRQTRCASKTSHCQRAFSFLSCSLNLAFHTLHMLTTLTYCKQWQWRTLVLQDGSHSV